MSFLQLIKAIGWNMRNKFQGVVQAQARFGIKISTLLSINKFASGLVQAKILIQKLNID